MAGNLVLQHTNEDGANCPPSFIQAHRLMEADHPYPLGGGYLRWLLVIATRPQFGDSLWDMLDHAERFQSSNHQSEPFSLSLAGLRLCQIAHW